MEQHKLFKMVHCGLFAALIFIGTQFMQVALPFGYFNFGDCLILLSALMLGRLYAMIAAAFGAALADVLSGYVIYAPATLIIKPFMVAAMAAVSGLGRGKRGKRRTGLVLLGVVAAESIMVCGYFLYDSVLYGFAGAAAALPGNILQGVIAVAASMMIMAALERSGLKIR